jgi:hypothetical protein
MSLTPCAENVRHQVNCHRRQTIGEPPGDHVSAQGTGPETPSGRSRRISPVSICRISCAAAAIRAPPVISGENYARALVVDGLRCMEPLGNAWEFGPLAIWFDQGTLTYTCPETTRLVQTGIITDTATVEKLSFFKLSVWCPHCGAAHAILGKEASISHSEDVPVPAPASQPLTSTAQRKLRLRLA